ncbi:MAG: hypothetical protein WCA08_08750 [Desulfoferrobacter sp.]
MPGKGRFGTFSGVFTPNVLTILGIILFLRTGWVVGQSGLVGALIIIVVANLISLLTGLSISAISTNMQVRTGGTYYMISRTLGLEIGGAIGLPLYLSQAISVAFYIIGFTEAFNAVYPILDPRIVSTTLAVGFGLLAYVGADFALKIQFFVLLILAMSLISFFSGGWSQWVAPELFRSSVSSVSFWHVFAIFFPAVTGITVGASMSGDLKDPAKSLPLGTLAAIGITGLIYVLVAVWLAKHVTANELVDNYMIMQTVAKWPELIIAGVWASTLSSALGSILAAPRTLQALATDRVVPRLFGAQLGSATEPRLAVLVTTAIAVGIIWMGNLDFVAAIITMFFLNTYGMINLTASIEQLIGNPSFRPQFKVPWVFSLLGAIGCYATMFLIDAKATGVAILISYGVFILLGRRSLRHDWGDIRSGIWFTVSRFGLIRLETVPWHVKNWRPNIVVFLRSPQSQEHLLEVGTWLARGRGIITFYHLIAGEVEELGGKGLRDTSRKHMQKYLDEHNAVAFTECSIVENLYSDALTMVQAHGLAGLEPNVVLLGWGTRRAMQIEQLRLLRKMVALRKSVLFLRDEESKGFGKKKRIDVWWRGQDRNGDLMVLIAHIISQSLPWSGAEIRILRLLSREEGVPGVTQHIEELLHRVRVNAEPKVFIRSAPDQPFTSVLRQHSAETDLVFLGLRVPDEDHLPTYVQEVDEILHSTYSCILVRSGEVENILDTDTDSEV